MKNYQYYYDVYVNHYNSNRKQITALAELNLVFDTVKGQVTHLQKVTYSVIDELDRLIEFQADKFAEAKKESKELVKKIRYQVENNIHLMNPDDWYLEVFTEAKRISNNHIKDGEDRAFELVKALLQRIKKIANNINSRNVNSSALHSVLIEILNEGYPESLIEWNFLSNEEKNEATRRGRDPDANAPQPEIESIVLELVENKFFLKNKKPKPTTIRDYLFNPFHPKYEKKIPSFTDSDKERHAKVRGDLGETQVFTRVKMALNSIESMDSAD